MGQQQLVSRATDGQTRESYLRDIVLLMFGKWKRFSQVKAWKSEVQQQAREEMRMEELCT